MKIQLKKVTFVRNGRSKKWLYKNNLSTSLNSGSEFCRWKWKSYLRMSGKNLPKVLLN